LYSHQNNITVFTATNKPIEIYKAEYLIMGPLDERAWPEQAAKEKAIPKDAMPRLIRRCCNSDKSMNDADFVCSPKYYEALLFDISCQFNIITI
jgi:hypothetical protein